MHKKAKNQIDFFLDDSLNLLILKNVLDLF